MKPESGSLTALGVTRSKAKMYEYSVSLEDHINITRDPASLFILSIGLLGDLAASINCGKEDGVERDKLRNNLQFSAYFFDAYFQAKLDEKLDPYLLLLGAAAYYLCELPGSSQVLINQLKTYPNLDGDGLEKILFWIIKGCFSEPFELDSGQNEESSDSGQYKEFIGPIANSLKRYFESGEEEEYLVYMVNSLRIKVYADGTPRQLLFGDLVGAVTRKRIANSCWYSLPRYSDIQVTEWKDLIQKESFIKELWPSQHLLGDYGVFRGQSAVVQMPTSAGKTKATELIIRSAFLSCRTSLAVIVAPFRALCHEIKNSLSAAFHKEAVTVSEFSDVLQADFDIEILLGKRQIVVTTPEKLIYVLRHSPRLADHIGVLIYDEGHQFDNGTRGVTYELLVTTLKQMVPAGVQIILVSAVISNAEAVNSWLNGSNGKVVPGKNLTPTQRTVAFASWGDQRGRLDFVDPNNIDQHEFFVPRIIEKHELMLKGKEYKAKFFPEEDGKDIALYLGLRIIKNGGVAIFCGTKAAASGLCNRAADIYERGFSLPKPVNFSDSEEIERLYNLHEQNLGDNASATRSSAIGILAHHSNIPHGIRLAVEHALKEGLARFVICTSTLAQGVNLPIRYLMVTSIYQGREAIKVRDFNNLIGRAGRLGMYTEGSTIFADPQIYVRRKSLDYQWKWEKVKILLDPEKSEPCASTLFTIFEPLESDNGKLVFLMAPIYIAGLYIDNPEELLAIPTQWANKDFSEESLKVQISERVNILAAIESYLMAQWDEFEFDSDDEKVDTLVKATLAYHLANEEQKNHLVDLFKLLAQNISNKVSEPDKRRSFSRTLFGVRTTISIESWVIDNIKHIEEAAQDSGMLLSVLWNLMENIIDNRTFEKCNPKGILPKIAAGWIEGMPYYILFESMAAVGAKIGDGKRPRNVTIDHVVDICDNALAFDGTLIVGAVTEIIARLRPNNIDLVFSLQELQKRLKYGLPASSALHFYEMGFSDRVIALELSRLLPQDLSKRRKILIAFKRNDDLVRQILSRFPAYYTEIYNGLNMSTPI